MQSGAAQGCGDIYSRGKQDVYDAYVNTNGDRAQVVKALKSWKGIGGCSGPVTEGFRSETHDSRGVQFRWVNDGLEYSGLIEWADIADLLMPHIESGAFFIPPKEYEQGCVSDRLWEEPLEYFFGYDSMTERDILLKEVVLGEYATSSKLEFLKAFFFGVDNYYRGWFYYPCICKNSCGFCYVDVVTDGIEIQFFDECLCKWKIHLDWLQCLSFLMYRFQQGIYLAESLDYLESALSKAPWCSRMFMSKYGQQFFPETCEERIARRLGLIGKVVEGTECVVFWNYDFDKLEVCAGTDVYSGRGAYEYLVERFFTNKCVYGIRCNHLDYADNVRFHFYRTTSL